MASWKKVIVSGSQASLAGISGSLLSDGALVYSKGAEGALTSVSDVSVTTDGHLDGKFSGSFNLNQLTDGNGIVDFTYDGNSDASIAVQADGGTLSVGTGGVKVADGGITATQLNSSVAGDGLTGGAGTALAVNVDDTSIEIDTDTLRVKAGGVSNAMLANQSVHISGSGINFTSVNLGATASIDVDVDDVTIEIADDSIQLKSGSISVGHLDSDLLVIESEGIASNDNDNTIATVAAIKDYVDQQVGGANLDITGSGDTKVSVDLNDEDLIFAGESGVMSVSASVADGDVTVTTAIVDGGIQNAKLAASGIRFSGSGISTDATVDLGATASINLNVDDSTVEVNADVLRVKDLGITNAKIANNTIANAKLVNDGITIGNQDTDLGGSVLNNLAHQATGSFTGSFVGDGSGLTGIATTLTVDSQLDGSVTADVDLLSDDLQIVGTANEVTSVVAKSGNEVTVTLGLPDDVTIGNDLTVEGDLLVKGDTTTINTQNLLVEDAFILLASGSTTDSDGGIIVDGGDNNGEGFVYDASATNGIGSHDAGRWGFQQSMADDASSSTPNAFASAVVIGSGNTPPVNTNRYSAKGNIFIATNEDIYIWS